MPATHQGLHPLQVEHPGPLGNLRRFGHHHVDAGLQPSDQGSGNGLGTGSPCDTPDVLQDIAKGLGVQRYDSRLCGQGNAGFGNLPSRDRSHLTDGLGQEQVWRCGA